MLTIELLEIILARNEHRQYLVGSCSDLVPCPCHRYLADEHDQEDSNPRFLRRTIDVR